MTSIGKTGKKTKIRVALPSHTPLIYVCLKSQAKIDEADKILHRKKYPLYKTYFIV